MRKLIIIALLFVFYKGFFSFAEFNSVLLSRFSDKTLHFAAFLLYPICFFILLPKKYYFIILNLLFFCVMTYGVEILQRKYFHRCYSMLDFKYSFFGVFCSCVIIIISYCILKLFSKKPIALS